MWLKHNTVTFIYRVLVTAVGLLCENTVRCAGVTLPPPAPRLPRRRERGLRPQACPGSGSLRPALCSCLQGGGSWLISGALTVLGLMLTDRVTGGRLQVSCFFRAGAALRSCHLEHSSAGFRLVSGEEQSGELTGVCATSVVRRAVSYRG